MSIYTVVSTAATVSFWGMEAAESALHMALQVDQGAYVRKATAEEESTWHIENHGEVYSGKEPSGNEFCAYHSQEGEIMLTAKIGDTNRLIIWPYERYIVKKVQEQLIEWGYPEMNIYVEDYGYGEGEL